MSEEITIQKPTLNSSVGCTFEMYDTQTSIVTLSRFLTLTRLRDL